MDHCLIGGVNGYDAELAAAAEGRVSVWECRGGGVGGGVGLWRGLGKDMRAHIGVSCLASGCQVLDCVLCCSCLFP